MEEEQARYDVEVDAWSWFDPFYLGVFTFLAAFRLASVAIPDLGGLAMVAFLLGTVALAVLRKRFAKTKPALLRIDADSVWIGEKRLARAGLEAAWKEAETGRAAPRVRVRLKGPFGVTNVLAENDAAADAILQTLGLVAGKTASYRAIALGAAFGGAAASVVALLVTIFGQMSAKVGSDGIFVKAGFRARFLPVQSLAAVEATPDGAAVLLTSGERIFLRIAVGAVTPAERDDFLRRVRALMAKAATRGATTEATAALVARGDSPRAAWLEALGKIAGGAGDYRLAAVPSEALEAVVTDDGADPTARAGAAYVLAKRGEAPRERLRVAAATSASPKVRVALEAAACDDEAALEEALAAVETAPPLRS